MVTIEELNQAAVHFLKHYVAGEPTIQLLKRYAMEEYKWDEEKAEGFAKAVEQRIDVKHFSSGEYFTRFLAWYHLNIVSKEPPQ